MVILKKSIPRRTFLRGAGASLALPVLDAMTAALAAEPQRRAALRLERRALVRVAEGEALRLADGDHAALVAFYTRDTLISCWHNQK